MCFLRCRDMLVGGNQFDRRFGIYNTVAAVDHRSRNGQQQRSPAAVPSRPARAGRQEGELLQQHVRRQQRRRRQRRGNGPAGKAPAAPQRPSPHLAPQPAGPRSAEGHPIGTPARPPRRPQRDARERSSVRDPAQQEPAGSIRGPPAGLFGFLYVQTTTFLFLLLLFGCLGIRASILHRDRRRDTSRLVGFMAESWYNDSHILSFFFVSAIVVC